MFKFTYLSKELFNTVQQSLLDAGYEEIFNILTGGDNDFVILDENAKKFAWFENGSLTSEELKFDINNEHIQNIPQLIQSLFEPYGNLSYLDKYLK